MNRMFRLRAWLRAFQNGYLPPPNIAHAPQGAWVSRAPFRPEVEPYEERTFLGPDLGGVLSVGLAGAGLSLLAGALTAHAAVSATASVVGPQSGENTEEAHSESSEGFVLETEPYLHGELTILNEAVREESFSPETAFSPNFEEPEAPWEHPETPSGERRFGTPPQGESGSLGGSSGTGIGDLLPPPFTTSPSGADTGTAASNTSSGPELSFLGSPEGTTRTLAQPLGGNQTPDGTGGSTGTGTGTEVPGALTATARRAYEMPRGGPRPPLTYEPNVGQTDSRVRFLARGAGFRTFLTDTGFVLDLARPERADLQERATYRDALRYSFVGANPEPTARLADEQSGRSNYFLGDQASGWSANVPQYGRVTYQNLYPGIDVVFHTNADRQLRYDFHVAAGADPSQIRLRVEGAVQTSLDPQGQLVVQTGGGRLVQTAPHLYQDLPGGERRTVGGRHRVGADGDLSFEVDSFDRSRPLVIDPTFLSSSYLGGTGDDKAYGVAVDGAGSTYVTGSTSSTDFPTTPGAYLASNAGGDDIFVTKLSPTGSVVYSTYLGNASANVGYGIAVDAAGNAYVTGATEGYQFPTTSGAYKNSAVGASGFVTKLNATGDALLYSTTLGDYTVEARAITVDALGQATVVGSVTPYFGSYYPFSTTGGAFQTSAGGGSEAFVLALNAAGSSARYASFLGGSGDEEAFAVAVDPDGNAYITGSTTSTNFPTTTGAYQTTSGGGAHDAFVTKVNASGSTKTYSTYLGGSGDDIGYGLSVNLSGLATVAGRSSGSYPTSGGAYQTTYGGGASDAVISTLNSAGTALSWSTYLGGTGDDIAYGVGVDLSGYPAVVGSTTGSFPTTTGAMQTTYGGGTTDGYITRLQTSATGLAYSSYLGGSDLDEARGVAVDPLANASVAGLTTSTDFPTYSPAQGSLSGSGTYDAWVARVSPKPLPPVITSITSDSGTSGTDFITTDSTLTLTGTATANATVTLYRAGVGQIGTTTANSSGDWSYDYSATTLPESTHAFWGTATVSGSTGEPSRETLVTVDSTAPDVALTVASSTTSVAPEVRITARDLNSLPDGTQVRLDADLNNDGDYLDSGESSYTTSTLSGGTVLIIPTAFSGTGTYRLRARVTDLAGNEATSSSSTVTVTSVTSWSGTAQVLTSDPAEGLALEQRGALRLAHTLDLDKSPGTQQGGNPVLVYNSDTVSVKPIVQTTVQSANNAALPATLTATLTFNGVTGSATNYSTTGLAKGDSLILATQASSAITATGRYAWSVTIQITGQPNIVLSGITYVVVQDSGPLGAGWTFSSTDRLIDIAADANGPAGKLRVYGTGGWRFYTGTTTFTSPSEDNGTLSSVTGGFEYTIPSGQKWIFNTNGYQTGWKSADVQELLTYTYDGSNNLSTQTAIDGAVTTFSYSSGKLSAITTVNGRTTVLNYSGSTLTRITNPDNGVHTFTYDANNRITREQFGPNVENNWSYASSGALATLTWGKSDSPSVTGLSPAAVQGLSAAGRAPARASKTDAYNYKSLLELDALARPTAHIAADGGVTRLSRDSNGRVTSQTDPLNRVTTVTRDSAGFVTQEAFPDGTTRNYAYQSSFHALTTLTDERNNVTTYAYDASGHLTSTTNALGQRVTLSYLSSGLLQSMQDARGNRTTYAYDSARRLSTVTNALADRATLTYDANGNVATNTDELGRTTTLTYDAMGRLTKKVDALAGTTTSQYDPVGLSTSKVNPLGRTNNTSYDIYKRGLLTGAHQAIGTGSQAGTLFSYDASGNPSSTRDLGGWSTAISTDAAGRPDNSMDALIGSRRAIYDLVGQVIARRDELGRWTKISYDARGRVTAITDPLGNTTTTVYDAVGNRTEVTDPINRITTFQYDAIQRQTVQLNALGIRVTTAYDAAGNVSTVTDSLARVTSYAYDALNRRTITTEAVGTAEQRTRTEAYDKVGNQTSTTDALGRTITITYDALNRPTSTIDPLGNVNSTRFDAAGNLESMEDPLNRITTFHYDARDRQVQVTKASGNTNYSILDAVGSVAGSINPAGRVNVQAQDPMGRPVVALDPLNNLSQKRYDAAGNMISSMDARGNETQFTYDGLNRLVQTKNALGDFTTVVYDAVGNTIATKDARGNNATFSYDALNRQITTTDPLGNSRSQVYDSAGNLKKMVDAEGKVTTYAYDALNRRITLQDPGTGLTTTMYDANDNTTGIIDPLGNRATYSYDLLNRRTATTDARGGVVTETYDVVGNRSALIDAVGNRTTFVYDVLNRQIEEIDSFNKSTTFSYDAVGNVISQTDRLGRRREYQYDNAGRMVGEVWVNVGGGIADVMTFNYDATNNLLIGSNGNGTYSMTYDGINRVTGVQELFGQRLTFSYDAVGNRTRVDDSKGGITTSTYDSGNRLIRRDFGGIGQTPLRIDLTYTTRNQQETQTRYSDLAGTTKVGSTTYTYDALGQMKTLQHRNGAGTLLVNTTYTYDLANRAHTETLNAVSTTYAYDATNQLTNDGTTSYSYDLNGNRTMTGYTTGIGNRLSSDGLWTYTYDDEGNLFKKSKGATAETWTFGYDHRNQMIWFEKRGSDGGILQLRADYKYDVWGNRIEALVDEDGNGPGGTSTTRYTYDGWKIRQDWSGQRAAEIGYENWDIWMDLDSSNSLVTRYLRGDDVDQLFSRVGSSGAAAWYLLDRLGSVRDITDSSGVIIDHLDYDGFGIVTNESSPSNGGRYKWTGREYNSESKLQYNRARMYDSSTGKWVTQDPISFAAGDTNLYRYVANFTQNNRDPSGLRNQSAHYHNIALAELYRAVNMMASIAVPINYIRSQLSAGMKHPISDRIDVGVLTGGSLVSYEFFMWEIALASEPSDIAAADTFLNNTLANFLPANHGGTPKRGKMRPFLIHAANMNSKYFKWSQDPTRPHIILYEFINPKTDPEILNSVKNSYDELVRQNPIEATQAIGRGIPLQSGQSIGSITGSQAEMERFQRERRGQIEIERFLNPYGVPSRRGEVGTPAILPPGPPELVTEQVPFDGINNTNRYTRDQYTNRYTRDVPPIRIRK